MDPSEYPAPTNPTYGMQCLRALVAGGEEWITTNYIDCDEQCPDMVYHEFVSVRVPMLLMFGRSDFSREYLVTCMNNNGEIHWQRESCYAGPYYGHLLWCLTRYSSDPLV